MVIRDFEDKDRPILEAFLVDFQEYERAIEPDRKPGEGIASIYLDYLLRTCRENDGHLLIAEEDVPMGYVCFWTESGFGDNCLTINAQVKLEDVYVVPSCRGKGVGKLLMSKVEEYGKRKGLPRMLLRVLANNHSARAVYFKNGWRDYETFMIKDLHAPPVKKDL